MTKGNHLSFLDLLECLEKGILWNSMDDIIYDKNQLDLDVVLDKRKNTSKYISPKDLRPIPDFSGLPLDLYRREIKIESLNKSLEVLILPYSLSEGCPNSCIFCPLSIVNPMFKNPKDVASEIRELSNSYNTNFFYFLDSTVSPTRRYAEKLIEEFKKQDVDIFWT